MTRFFLRLGRGPRRVHGFTLVELLVSIVVLTLLTLALFNVLNSTTTAWNRTEQQTDAFREARAAMEIISRDLRSMVPISGRTYLWLSQDQPPANSGITISDYRSNSGHGDTVFVLTSRPKELQDQAAAKSDVCTVGFYVSFSVDNPLPAGQPVPANAPRSYKLHRFFESSDATFTRLKANAPIVADATKDEVLARNIVDFHVEPFETNSSPSSYTATTPPAFLKISLRAVGQSAASAMSSLGDQTEAQKEWEGTGLRFKRLREAASQSFIFYVAIQ